MPSSKHLNYYGFLGLFVALAAVASYLLINSKECKIFGGDNYQEYLQPIHIAGIICGGVLFLLSFLNIAGALYDIRLLFFLAIICILGVGGVMFWAAYIAFSEPCVNLGLGFNKSIFEKNAFDAKDTHNIGVFVLDIVAGLMLISIGFTFAKRL